MARTGAWSASTSPARSPPTFRVADYRRLFRRARQYGLGITVHTGESGPVEEVARVIELLEPDRIGHGVKAAYDPRTMAMIRERGIVLEICPTSNLNTRVVSGWDEFRWIFDTFRRNDVRFTINTDGPEMLKTYIRDEMATLGATRHPVGRGAGAGRRRRRWPRRSCRTSPTCRRPRREPARREVVEREEADRPSPCVRRQARAGTADHPVRSSNDRRRRCATPGRPPCPAPRGTGRAPPGTRRAAAARLEDRAVVLDQPDPPSAPTTASAR